MALYLGKGPFGLIGKAAAMAQKGMNQNPPAPQKPSGNASIASQQEAIAPQVAAAATGIPSFGLPGVAGLPFDFAARSALTPAQASTDAGAIARQFSSAMGPDGGMNFGGGGFGGMFPGGMFPREMLGQQPGGRQLLMRQGGFNPLLQRGFGEGMQIRNWLAGNFMHRPQQMANQLNQAFGDQVNRNAQRVFANRALEADFALKNRIIDAISGLAGGLGGGGGGFVGEGGQFAVPGRFGTNISANTLDRNAIEDARNRVAPEIQNAPSGIPMTDAQQSAVAQTTADAANAAADQIGVGMERDLTDLAGQLGLNIQGAEARQGVNLANYLNRLQGLNTNRVLPLIQLLGSLA